jgi:hypothetical protein
LTDTIVSVLRWLPLPLSLLSIAGTLVCWRNLVLAHRRNDEIRGAVDAFRRAAARRETQLTRIAAYVNAYHNGDNELTAADTVAAISDVLGPPF